MKRKQNKISKWLTILGCSSLCMAGMAGFSAAAASMTTASSDHTTTDKINQADAVAVNFNILDNLVIDVTRLNADFAKLYFAELHFDDPADPQATAVLNAIQNELNTNTGY